MSFIRQIKKIGAIFGLAAMGAVATEPESCALAQDQDQPDPCDLLKREFVAQSDHINKEENIVSWAEADSTKAYYTNPVNFPDVTGYKTGQWHVALQMEKTEKSEAGYDIGVGELILTAPDGVQNRFQFRSGGFGPYQDESMIPGLARDDIEPFNYDIGWDRFFIDMPMARYYVGPDGRGEFLRLYSDPEKTDRGLTWEQRNGKGAFALHTDGAAAGSQGCVVFSHLDSEKLFKILEDIPKKDRPTQLNMMPGSDILQKNFPLRPVSSRAIGPQRPHNG